MAWTEATAPSTSRLTVPKADAIAATARGSSINSSTASSIERAAATISCAAAWRCSRLSRAASAGLSSAVVTFALLRVVARKDHPQSALSERRVGDGPAAQRVRQQQRPAIRPHPDQQLVVLATDFKVVVVRKGQL